MSVTVDTEEQFDSEFDVDALAQDIVDRIKKEVKLNLSKKKRHKQ